MGRSEAEHNRHSSDIDGDVSQLLNGLITGAWDRDKRRDVEDRIRHSLFPDT